MRAFLRGVVLVAALAFSVAARAQGFALEKYEPTPAGSWFFGVVHPWYSSTRWFAGGLTLDYAHNPLLAGLFDEQGQFHQTAAVVEHMLVGHVDLAGSFLDRVQLNFSLPVTLLERGTPAFGVAPLDGAAVGDPRLGVYVRLWGQPDTGPVSIHLGGYVWIPVGANAEHQGDRTARGLPQVILAGLIKERIRWAFNLGFLIRAESTLGFGPANSTGTELQAGLAAAYADTKRRFQVGPELLFSTVIVNGHAFKEFFSALDLLIGGQYNIARQVNVGAAVGIGTLSQLGYPDVRVIFRAAYAPIKGEEKPRDRDKDGIADVSDACPEQAGPASDDPKTHGCPDRDGDKVVDRDDLCPDEPMGAKPDPDKRGCPLRDADGDGIPDAEDLCPGQAAGAQIDPLKKGCPFIDADGDGIPDAEDLCPQTKPGKYPDSAKQGCPQPDEDGDGVPDAIDSCPKLAGLLSDTDPTQNGCPKLELKQGKATELRMVNFEVNKWVLLPESLPILDALAKELNAHPEWKQIVIEGHASDEGTKAWNMRLSKNRAKTVMEYLNKQGVKRGRLSYTGFGDTRPLVPAQNEEARAKNRRVEVRILDQK